MQRKQFEEFLIKVRTGNESFMLTDGKEFDAFVQFSVNDTAKIVFSDYRYHRCNASDVVSMKLEPVALVCGNSVYLIDDYRFRSADMAWGYKWEDNFENVIRLGDLLKSTRSHLLSHLIPELYEKLPAAELDEDRIESAKQEARRRLLHKELFAKEKPLADMNDLLSGEEFIRVLCGELHLEGHVTAQYFKNKEVRANIKAYEEEVQKHIDSPICCDWELSLADALRESGAKTVTMEFCFRGKRAVGKINVEQFLREMGADNNIEYWDFATSVEGKMVLDRLDTGWKREDRLYPCHVTSVTYGKKTIYEAPEELKELQAEIPEKEDDDYER